MPDHEERIFLVPVYFENKSYAWAWLLFNNEFSNSPANKIGNIQISA